MDLIRMLHVTAGLFIGVIGLLQIILPKGGSRHRTLGQIYFWSWPVVVATGGFIGNPLITLFATLGMYMAFTGMRMAQRKRIRKKLLDKVVICLAIVLSFATLIWGIILTVDGYTFGLVAIIFGLIFSTTTIFDLLDFILGKRVRKTSGTKTHWYFEHITRMFVSYIAALTAFFVIQKIFSYDFLNWTVPALIGTFLIFISQFYFKRKLENR